MYHISNVYIQQEKDPKGLPVVQNDNSTPSNLMKIQDKINSNKEKMELEALNLAKQEILKSTTFTNSQAK